MVSNYNRAHLQVSLSKLLPLAATWPEFRIRQSKLWASESISMQLPPILTWLPILISSFAQIQADEIPTWLPMIILEDTLFVTMPPVYYDIKD